MKVILREWVDHRPDTWFEWTPSADSRQAKASLSGPAAREIIEAAEILIRTGGVEFGRPQTPFGYRFKDSPYTNKYDMAIVIQFQQYKIPEGWPKPEPNPRSKKAVAEEERMHKTGWLF